MKKISKFIILLSSLLMFSCGSENSSNKNNSDNVSENEYAIRVTEENLFVAIGETRNINFLYKKIEGAEAPIWDLGDSNIINVNHDDTRCVIKGLNIGQTYVSLTYNGYTATSNVEVTIDESNMSVKLDHFNSFKVATIPGLEIDLSASFYIDDVKNGDATFTYSCTSEKVVLDGSKFKSNEIGEYSVSLITTFSGQVLRTVANEITVKVLSSNNNFEQKNYKYIGRYIERDGEIYFDNVDSGIEVAFVGTSFSIKVINPTGIQGKVKLLVDGEFDGTSQILNAYQNATISGIGYSKGVHIARVINVFEDGFTFNIDMSTISAESYAELDKNKDISMLILGDSLTTGYAALGGAHCAQNTDSSLSYAYKIGNKFDAELEVLASQGIGVRYGWRNAINDNQNMLNLYTKNSIGDISTDYINKAHDIVIINLGTNDYSLWSSYERDSLSFDMYYYQLLEMLAIDNPNAYIFCIYGMAGKASEITFAIDCAIEAINDDYDNIHAFSYYNFVSTSNGHPLDSEHTVYCNNLYSFMLDSMAD